jgi:AcrR family transcriptional regulator
VVPERRQYESLVRTARAGETRRAIAAAARRLFVTRGWEQTTVREVAREAGVSVPTVYSAYGNKTGLALALVDAADVAAEPERLIEELTAAGDDPARQLAAAIGFDRRMFERSGDVLMLIREAGRTNPELAAAHREGPRRGEQARLRVFASWPAGTLRDGLTPRTGSDIYAAICGVAAYTELTSERGWEPERVERWWIDCVTRELLG